MNVPRKHHPLLPSTVIISTPLTTLVVVVVTAASARTRSSRCRDDSNDRAQQEFAETPYRVQRILDDSTSKAKENIDHETDPCFDIGSASCLRCVDRRVGGERRFGSGSRLGTTRMAERVHRRRRDRMQVGFARDSERFENS